MNFFSYRDDTLCAESVPLVEIAERFGTPSYVYSRAALELAYHEFDQACSGHEVLICYSVKANSNLAVLNVLARLGSGFDIVSGGELARVLAAGGSAAKTVFSGVGKTEAEMRGALEAGVLCFNVESEGELARLAAVARSMGKIAPVSLRINPDVDPKTHPYVATGLRESKFGIPYDAALPLYRKAVKLPELRVTGIDVHIGSQITDVEPFVAALEKVLEFVDVLDATGVHLEHLDLGGGLGIRYRDEAPPAAKDYLEGLFRRLGKRDVRILFEPGRSLVGNTGLLLTRVEYLKQGGAKNFVVTDAAMNDLLRPALYDAWHEVLPVARRNGPAQRYDIVGPVCESADFLARGRALTVAAADLLAIMSAGAYGMTMSSNYNSRPRPAEVMVDGKTAHLVRDRESVENLFASERLLP
ncbi:MAG: diaminopimelate decarboxylase [Betaproteobacteria bacterium]|nr:MAG: diaminopimelate decarboxylase [Betaproteobacteria bacterium]